MSALLTRPRNYMPQLDALRALAVAAVAWSHWAPREYQGGVPWGPYGVRLFFVLSGFLITAILLDCRHVADQSPGGAWFALRSFYVRRFLRLFPLYYAVLFIAAICYVPSVRTTLGWTLTYTTNFYLFQRGSWDGVISHFWSLAVEEQFYLVWPWVIMFLPARWLRPAVVGAVVGSAGLWLAILWTPAPIAVPINLPVLCCDALGLGALLALVEPPDARRRLAGAALLVGLPCWLAGELLPRVGISSSLLLHWLKQESLLLVYLWLIHQAAAGFQGTVGRVLENRMLVGLGTISYGLYVIHNFAPIMLRTLERMLNLPQWLARGLPTRVVLLSAITIALAWVSWQILENPIQAFKRYFPYRRNRLEGLAAQEPKSSSQPMRRAA